MVLVHNFTSLIIGLNRYEIKRKKELSTYCWETGPSRWEPDEQEEETRLDGSRRDPVGFAVNLETETY